MSTISATRKGFLYQDRAAVSTYLDFFQTGDVKEFYVDFPFPSGQKSIDFRLVKAGGNEEIFEVKSGEEFKLDKRKGESSEIRDAFVTLKEYFDQSQTLILNLIIRKEFTSDLGEYWSRMTSVQGYSAFAGAAKVDCVWLHNKLRLPGIADARSFFNFCKKMKFISGSDDELRGRVDHFPNIDDEVVTKIDDIASTFGASACSFEYPSSILMLEMYHESRLLAGRSKNLHPAFKNKIIDFIAHRKLLDGYNPGRHRERTKEDCINEVSEKIQRHLGEISNPSPQMTMTTENLNAPV